LSPFDGRDHWFGKVAQRELAAVLSWMKTIELEPDLLIWLRTALSSIINRISYQDGETRYARVDRSIRPGNVIRLFEERASSLLVALDQRGPLAGESFVAVGDTASRIPLKDRSVDLIVTSPPYANTMDYYLYHKQRMNVLGYNFKKAQSAEVGSRWEFSSLKAPQKKWEADLLRAIEEMYRVLKPGGDAMVIIGDSQIGGQRVDAGRLVARLGRSAGFETGILESTSMSGRSRSFSAAFQRPDKLEHLVSLRK
jgi:site-specific DNA-methyltransferase (cytosine-N4-specific)